MSFSVFIPSRYDSVRFPGKPLADLGGKTMIRRVYDRASMSAAERVIVATDDDRIREEVESFGGQVVMTASDHPTGTDRIHEAAQKAGLGDDAVVVNVQGDEPLIPVAAINQVAAAIKNHGVEMATLKDRITDIDDVFDPNVVKVVSDGYDRALYFSRAPLPWSREGFDQESDDRNLKDGSWYRHLGLYAYTVAMLKRFVDWPVSELESIERLEQLRALEHGTKIHVGLSLEPIPPGIDVPADVDRTLQYLD